METVDMPRRRGWQYDKKRLLELDRSPPNEDGPTHLPLDELLVMDNLFQPRGTSLLYRAGASSKHIADMAAVVRSGRALDPMVVVAFGSRWVLVDGHHRRAAYLKAEYDQAVPVVVHTSPERGEDRVTWAVALSLDLNTKDKLAMSPDDKMDAAWRMVVMRTYSRSRTELSEAANVGTRSVANMRQSLKALREADFADSELYDWTWARARFEYRRLTGDSGGRDPDFEQKQLEQLVRRLAKVIPRRTDDGLLLHALELIRPGFATHVQNLIESQRRDMKEDQEAYWWLKDPLEV